MSKLRTWQRQRLFRVNGQLARVIGAIESLRKDGWTTREEKLNLGLAKTYLNKIRRNFEESSEQLKER